MTASPRELAYAQVYQAYGLLREAYETMRLIRDAVAEDDDTNSLYLYGADAAALSAALHVLQGHFNNNIVPDEELHEIADSVPDNEE